jgi:enterochelin esterase-like enzyme
MRCLTILSSLLLLAGCATPERLTYAQIDSAALHREMGYAVWAPLDLKPEERLPLLVFLHGGGDDEMCFDDARVGEFLDQALARGEIPRVIIAIPDGGLGFWENWYDGSHRYRDWVIDEMMPEVETRFRTLPCPEGCHVAGVSMGGHGAIRFALFRPDLFSSAATLSGPILSTDDVTRFAASWFTRLFIPMNRIWGPVTDVDRLEREDPYRRWASQDDLHGLRLMVAWAEGDRSQIIESDRAFEHHLVESGIRHDHVVFRGGHNWKSWTPVLEQVLRFSIWGSMNATAPPVAG